MPIERIDNFDEDQWEAEMAERARKVMIRHCLYIGERCLSIARNVDSFKDQTGNLRSSIGYVLVVDGVIYKQALTFGKGKQGAKIGIEYMNKLVAEHSKGVCLIFVAGMQYAVYVSARGYDVIDSAEIEAIKLFENINAKL